MIKKFKCDHIFIYIKLNGNRKGKSPIKNWYKGNYGFSFRKNIMVMGYIYVERNIILEGESYNKNKFSKGCHCQYLLYQ